VKEAARGLFDLGAGLSDRLPEMTNDWPLLTFQFGSVTGRGAP